MNSALQAGIALYTAGDYHAAHEPWEKVWLELPDSTDEQLLHGLIQYTAAVYHARKQRWEGAVGLAGQAQQYLSALPTAYNGINTDRLIMALQRLETDPVRIEREAAPPLRYHGERLTAADLEVDGIITAASTLAGESDAYDLSIIETAVNYAREEATGSKAQFIGMLTAFVDDRDHRNIVYDRLRKHVERQQAKREDVAGLFE